MFGFRIHCTVNVFRVNVTIRSDKSVRVQVEKNYERPRRRVNSQRIHVHKSSSTALKSLKNHFWLTFALERDANVCVWLVNLS